MGRTSTNQPKFIKANTLSVCCSPPQGYAEYFPLSTELDVSI